MRSSTVLACIAAAFVATGASAVDDRFNPGKYDKGGLAPASDEAYAKECGSCHFTYLPGMLPERSWRKIMASTNEHFGESLSLEPRAVKHIESYLAANAADHSSYRGAELMLWELPKERTPVRITMLPIMRHRHVVVRKLMADTNSPVKKLTNCDTCHETAATGSFAYDQIVVPGVSKVVRPGGMF